MRPWPYPMQPQKTQRKSVPNHLVVCSVRTRPDLSAIYIHIYRHGTSETTSRTLPVRRKPASHPAKPNQKRAWGTPSKKPNSSKIRCKPSGKTEPKRCLGSAFEEAEQQQDSRPCHAKPQPQKRKIRAQAVRNRNEKKLSKRCLRNALERKNHQAKPNQKSA